MATLEDEDPRLTPGIDGVCKVEVCFENGGKTVMTVTGQQTAATVCSEVIRMYGGGWPAVNVVNVYCHNPYLPFHPTIYAKNYQLFTRWFQHYCSHTQDNTHWPDRVSYGTCTKCHKDLTTV